MCRDLVDHDDGVRWRRCLPVRSLINPISRDLYSVCEWITSVALHYDNQIMIGQGGDGRGSGPIGVRASWVTRVRLRGWHVSDTSIECGERARTRSIAIFLMSGNECDFWSLQ
jgi:hypothetical protein